jgi:hypothetical protein
MSVSSSAMHVTGVRWATLKGSKRLLLDEGRPGGVVAFPGGRGITDMMTRARLAGVEVIEAAAHIGGAV